MEAISNQNSEAIPAMARGDGGWPGFVGSHGGGWLPPDGAGEFSARIMGEMMGVDEKTVRRFVKENRVEVREMCGQIFITPEAIRSRCKKVEWQGRRKTGD